MNNGIVLLSGGLDSYVSLDIAFRKAKVGLALIFDYGQKAFKEECDSAIQIANSYNIEYKIVQLPFLKEIIDNALVNPLNNNFNELDSVWIANRNGLFLNIAASYCDKFGYDFIVFGANKEEAQKFSDNSVEFVEKINECFKFSTIKQPKVFAPCLNFDKIEIINYAIDNNLSFKLLKSCYRDGDVSGMKHCGTCMSCKYLKNALLKSKKPQLVEEIF